MDLVELAAGMALLPVPARLDQRLVPRRGVFGPNTNAASVNTAAPSSTSTTEAGNKSNTVIIVTCVAVGCLLVLLVGLLLLRGDNQTSWMQRKRQEQQTKLAEQQQKDNAKRAARDQQDMLLVISTLLAKNRAQGPTAIESPPPAYSAESSHYARIPQTPPVDGYLPNYGSARSYYSNHRRQLSGDLPHRSVSSSPGRPPPPAFQTSPTLYSSYAGRHYGQPPNSYAGDHSLYASTRNGRGRGGTW